MFFNNIKDYLDLPGNTEKVTTRLFVLGTIAIYLSISLHQIVFAIPFLLLLFLFKRKVYVSTLAKCFLLFVAILHPLSLISGIYFQFGGSLYGYKGAVEQLFYSLVFLIVFLFSYDYRFHVGKVLSQIPAIAFVGGFFWAIFSLVNFLISSRAVGPWGGVSTTSILLSVSIFSTIYLFQLENLKLRKLFYALALLLFLIVSYLAVGAASIFEITLGTLILLISLYKLNKIKLNIGFVLSILVSFFLILLVVYPFLGSEFFPSIKWGVASVSDSIKSLSESIGMGNYVPLLTGWESESIEKNIPYLLAEFMKGGVFAFVGALLYTVAVIFLFYRSVREKDLLAVYMSVILVSNLIIRNFTGYFSPIGGFYLVVLSGLWIRAEQS